ncbi:unnamed protein product [Spirodela intermedia]|uniref:X8 domain-containing protein n=1 Tax=Spirodela intermedia TaxID=51605 RepID=A0A7I8IIB9_SPIIN|nr:unnamed protein product [Spirodela intermedia]CAA6656905.1 unnamed protein product [Spirodela intermedia]
MLGALNASRKAAEGWVHDNVTRYVSGNAGAGVVRIEYVAIGDEPFLLRHGDKYGPFVQGAATNIRLALAAVPLASRVKVVVPCGTDVFDNGSTPPFLKDQGSPFVVNIYPFFILQQNRNFTTEMALFQPVPRPLRDGRSEYSSLFAAAIDTLVSSLSAAGSGAMEVVVGKIGWPTDGAVAATVPNAQIFMTGLLQHLQGGGGTPLRPKRPPATVYLFSLLDEDLAGGGSGSVERHFGVFTFDGQAKYSVDLGQGPRALDGAKGVDYLPSRWCVVDDNKDLSNVSTAAAAACSTATADCSTLAAGGSCGNLSWPGNVSYAFNSYYQRSGQSPESCDFGGMGLITTVDPSAGECRFAVGIRASSSFPAALLFPWWSLLMTAPLLLLH